MSTQRAEDKRWTDQQSTHPLILSYDKETATFQDLSVNGLLHVVDIGTIVFPQNSPVLQINH